MMNSDLEIFRQFAREGNEPSLEGKTQAVIYTRVSTKEQAENNASLETQMKYCEIYAKKRNLTVVEYFGGTYESAKSDERKEFQSMLSFVKRNNKIAYIIVYSFDRFSRTGANGSYITAQLKKRGIIVLSATQEVDATTSAGSFQQDLFFLFSKFDNELRRDKSVSGMQEKLRKGYINGIVPFGYTNMNPGKGKLPELIINEQGELLRKAFEMKAKHDLTYMEITQRLKPLGWSKGHKKLSDYFRNPIYCGLIVSSLIPGEVIEGKHPPLVSKEVFLKVNGLLQKKKYGGNYSRDDENLPLKQFVIAESCGTPYTGYLVKKKGLYYYKNNRIGSKENRSAKRMHELFVEFLQDFQLKDKDFLLPIKEIVQNQFAILQQESIDALLIIAEKSKEVEQNLETIERRFVLGEITKDLFQKYKTEFDQELMKIRKQLENSHFKLSNLDEALSKAMEFALDLPEMWQSGSLEIKRRIQKIVFPDGIRYNHQNHTYRTTRVNLLFAGIPLIQNDLLKKENGTSPNFKNLSRLVLEAGVLNYFNILESLLYHINTIITIILF